MAFFFIASVVPKLADDDNGGVLLGLVKSNLTFLGGG